MRSKLLVAALVSIGLTAFFSSVAQAYGQFYYNNIPDADQATLTIASSEFVEESEVNLRIYYPTRPASGVIFRVYDYHLCTGVGRNDTVRTGRNFNRGDSVTQYQILTGQGQVRSTFTGNYYTDPSSSSCSSNSTYQGVIQQSWLTLDPGTGLYFVKFRATVAGGANDFVNKFSVSIPASGGVIAPEGASTSGNESGSAVMIERPRQVAEGTGSGRNRDDNFSEYTMGFGSSCEVPAGGQTAQIRFYDLDNVRDGNNPTSAGTNAQEYRSIKIQLRNADTRALIDLTVGGRAPTRTVYPPYGANNQTFAMSFRAMPGQRYELLVNDVYVYNTIQFTLPYDGIYWNIPCDPDPSTVVPTIDLTHDAAGSNSIGGAVEEGDPIHVQTNFRNTGDQAASIRYTRQVWWDVDGNDTYNIAPGGPDRWINSATNETVNLAASGSSRLPPIYQNASLDNGQRRLCVRLFTNSNNDQTVVRDQDRNLVRCVLIGKTPTFQAWGSDVRVGGSGGALDVFSINSSIKSSQSPSVRNYGSWGEYGVFASGAINGFGSAATLKTGVPGATTPSANSLNQLTFANTPTSGRYANSAGIGVLPRESIKSHPAFNANLVTTMPRGTISNTQIYRSNSNVTINENISYRDTVGSVSSLPQVVIIAPNISIAQNVTRIDAWLIADNTIDTCAGTDNMTVSRCNQQLNINGPVMARTLKLKRTHTVADNKAVPAETINLRSDAYIWAFERYGKSSAGGMRTSYISELPPRY